MHERLRRLFDIVQEISVSQDEERRRYLCTQAMQEIEEANHEVASNKSQLEDAVNLLQGITGRM